MAAATHFIQLECVHHLSFRRLLDVFLGQVNHLLRVHAAGHLDAANFAEVVLILVGEDVAAREALDGNDHVLSCVSDVCSNSYITPSFLNQFLKIMEFMEFMVSLPHFFLVALFFFLLLPPPWPLDLR